MSTPSGPDFVLAPPPAPAPELPPADDQRGPKYLWLLVILLIIAALIGIAIVIGVFLFSHLAAQEESRSPIPTDPTPTQMPPDGPTPGVTPGPGETEQNQPDQQARREVMDYGFVGVLAAWKVGVTHAPQSTADLTVVTLSVKNYLATDRAPGDSLAAAGTLPSGRELTPVPCPQSPFDWSSAVSPNAERTGHLCFNVAPGESARMVVSVKHTGVPAGELHFRDS